MRILLIRTSALGDIVHALPVLTALRRHLPTARIGWVVDEAFASLLAGHRDLDVVLPVALRRWGRQPVRTSTARELGAALAAIRGFRAEVALDLMGNFKAGVLAWVSGAPRRVGHSRRERREPASALFINEMVATNATHAVDRGLSLLAPLGVQPSAADFGGGALAADDAEGLRLLASARRPVVLIQPGAGWANKRYPPAWWGQVARRLASARVDVRVLSSRGEEPIAEQVVAASGEAAQHWHAPTLPMLVTLLAGARLVLGGDTGPIHLAHALGRTVLSLCGPTDPARNGPYGDPDASLAVRLPCSFCHRRFDEVKACLLSLSPEVVATRALGRLSD